jgi:hypothetical protein
MLYLKFVGGEVKQGDTADWVFRVSDQNGVATDLTGMTPYLSVGRPARAPDGTDTFAALMLRRQGTIVSAPGGTFKISPTSEDVDEAGEFYCDVVLVLGAASSSAPTVGFCRLTINPSMESRAEDLE